MKTPPSQFLSDYGIVLALLILCGYFSWVTFDWQHPNGTPAAQPLAEELIRNFPAGTRVLIAAPEGQDDVEFAHSLANRLRNAGFLVVETITGQPALARQALERLARAENPPHLIACNHTSAGWGVFENLGVKFPELASASLVTPRTHRWPSFLKMDNLLNIANQIAVIAIIAIGMTMVIITAGIDLSSGSLIALSAVVSTLLIRDFAGAENASAIGMLLSCLAGIALCGAVGCFSGFMVAVVGIPAFIATLGMMLVASGLAFIVAQGQSIYQVPDTFVWLGRGANLAVPNAVLLMLALYALAHVMMSRMALGRYIYAVGGNPEAARLSGVPIKSVLIFVYTLSAMLAGVGGIVMASQLKSGAPTYGGMYELYVIAAVVVGGTSLSGGEGKVLGTLIGAFIIAVIQNGMNLTGVESYTQKVVLGLVILGAVLLDMLKRKRWNVKRWFGRSA
ncbi:MAG: ABC transporter permease [Verrucomicrobia bacterium]|nr:ABC transporter permease [Verrucomicrobiota bacterium]